MELIAPTLSNNTYSDLFYTTNGNLTSGII